MRTIFLIFLISAASLAQSVYTSVAYLYQDFAANVEHTGSTSRRQGSLDRCPGLFVNSNELWSPTCGGPSGTFAYNGFTFSAEGLVVDHRVPEDEPTTSITNLTSAASGYIRIWTPGHGLAQDTYGQGGVNGTRYAVRVSGVNTCTSGASDCGTSGSYNGLWMAAAILYQASGAMTGTNTFRTASTGSLANGDTVFLYCSNNAAMNYQEFAVTNVTATTADLVGFTGTLCNSVGVMFDNMRLDLIGSSRTGTFSSLNPSGTIRKVANGYGVQTITYPHYTQLANRYNFALAGHMPAGVTWNPEVNRLRWEITCDYTAMFNPNKTSASVGSGGYNLGTFTKADTAGQNNTYQGVHWYHYFYGNQYAYKTMYFEAMANVNHTNIRSTVTEAPDDFTYIAPVLDNTATHYWDAMVEFYIDWGPVINGYGNNTTKNAIAAGGVCTVANMTVAKITGEPDTWVSQVQGTYNGTGYELAWNTKGNIPSTTYAVRYSTGGSMHANGWSSGTAAGTATSGALSSYQNVFFESAPMAEAATIWWAIRPTMQVASVSGTGVSPIVITPYGGHDLQTGDQVTTSGVTNVTNGTYTITRIPSVSWNPTSGTWTSTTVAAGSGSCTPQCATATVASTAGIYVGQQIFIYFSKSGGGVGTLDTDANAYRAYVREIVDGTHFKHNTTAAAGVTHTPTCQATTRICGAMATFAGMALQGTTGTGTAGTAVGTVTSTSDTTGFYEIGLPATPPPVINPLTVSPSSLEFSGSIGGANPASQTLTASCPGGCGTVLSSSNQAWCDVSQAGSVTTVAPDITGLTEGTYACAVTITASGASTGSPVDIPVYLTISATPVNNTGQRSSGTARKK